MKRDQGQVIVHHSETDDERRNQIHSSANQHKNEKEINRTHRAMDEKLSITSQSKPGNMLCDTLN